MIKYHDEEWGRPVHEERLHFEFLLLETMQAGLSWQVVLNKREALRKVFDNFDYDIICNYEEEKLQKLLSDESIIKNKIKIQATIYNAKIFKKV